MNPRWLCLGVLVLVPLAGCAANSDDSAASAVSFSAVAAAGSPAHGHTTTAEVDLASAGTVCGWVPTTQGSATVAIRRGHANCGQVLQAARAYAAAATNVDGEAVTVEVAGWRCTARATDTTATCTEGDNTVRIG